MINIATQLALLTSVAGGSAEDHVRPHAIAKLFEWNPGFDLPLMKGERPYEFYFTNHLLMTLVAAAVTLLIFVPIGRRYATQLAEAPVDKSVPRGFTGLVEALMDALRTGVVKPVLGDQVDRYMPFLWTVFFYILINNLLGMIPLDAMLSLAGIKHMAGTATGNVNVTAGLALCAFGMFHISGVKQVFAHLIHGTYGHHHEEDHSDDHHSHTSKMSGASAMIWAPLLYVWNFAPHVFAPGPDASGTMKVIMTIADTLMWIPLLGLELIGAIVKPFALCMRLFANMVAGHTVLASLLLLIPAAETLNAAYFGAGITVALGCTALSCLELFVAFLQAFIFMFLSTMFINMAANPEH